MKTKKVSEFIIDWLKKERPGVIKKMERGIEPGFGKLLDEYKALQ